MTPNAEERTMTENTLTRESESCAHCGTTEGRIEHGGYYLGRPVCDACNEYAEAHGGAERPTTFHTAMNLIVTAVDLDSLRDTLQDIEDNADEIVRADIDYSALPTFGGLDIVDTTDIWSWDATRVLVCDTTGDGRSTWSLRDRCTVTVANPWTGAMVDIDLDGMTDDQFNGYVAAIADDVREELHEMMAPCTPQAYMAVYVAMVGPQVAGIALLS